MRIDSLRTLFSETLACLSAYDQRCDDALPAMVERARNPALKAMLDRCLAGADERSRRLDACFAQLGEDPRSAESPATMGLIAECDEIADCEGDPEVIDAALIGGFQAIIHYGIAWYGCARSWAGRLGNEQAADLLQATVDELGRLDQELSGLAEESVNQRAR